MSYINDPRELPVYSEDGIILEQDNRKEEKYHWGAMVVDLCDLPVEEYMKPMTVICLGGGGEVPDTGETMYTLKFIVDGVAVGEPQKLLSGDPIPFPANPEKDGRNFLGWFYNGKEYKEGDSMPSRSLTLTAKYSCNVSFVFVVGENEEEVSAYTVSYNTKLSQIPSTSKPGYKFIGWEPNTASTIVEHTVFKATFEPIVYIVTWSGYTDGVKEETKYYGDFIYEPEEVPVKEGYTFNGWDKTFPIVVESDIKINAKFTINKYEISYYISIDGEEGEPISSTTLTYNSTIPSKKKPSQSGYTFSDWKGYNAETSEVFEGTKMPAYNVKYVSERTTNEYIVKYFDNNELIREETYLYGAVITPYVYEKIGWTVSEWSNLPETMPAYDIEVHCVSVINSYKVVFMDEKGNSLYEIMAEYGTKIENLLPSFKGKTYIISDEMLNATVEAKDMEIYGKLTINEYEITIIINDDKQEIVKLPYESNVDEYILANYKPEEGYSMVYSPMNSIVPDNNSLVINVNYKPNIWILAYSTIGADDKDLNGSKEVAYNTLILPELPATELDGYVFKGWFNGENKVDEDDTMPNSNLSVNGTYEIMSFIVIVKDGEKEVLNKKYTYGTKLQVVLDDIKEYRDNLYNEGYETIVNIDTEGIIKSDLEFEIERAEREFVLTFMNGENIISSAMVKYNATIVYPEMSGYTENGIDYVFIWEDSSYNGESMPAMNITIIGNYQEKAAAPIYYGSFVVPVSAYSEDNHSQYVKESDVDTSYYQSVSVSECVDNDKLLVFIYPPYPPLVGLSPRDLGKQKLLYYEPTTLLMPVDVINNYNIASFKAGDSECWTDMKTDNVEITIKGNKYLVYAVAYSGSRPSNVDTPYEYILKLTKK